MRLALVLALLLACSAAAGFARHGASYPIASNGNAGFPTNQSAFAATQTVMTNPLCARTATATNAGTPITNGAALGDYWWEIGSAQTWSTGSVSGPLVSGQIGTQFGRLTLMNVDSASKWIYGMYLAQLKGAITGTDVTALNFTDGYFNMQNTSLPGSSATCAGFGSAWNCSQQQNGSAATKVLTVACGQAYDFLAQGQSYINTCAYASPPANYIDGRNQFYYDSGHMQHNVEQFRTGCPYSVCIADDSVSNLGKDVKSILFTPAQISNPLNFVQFYYTQSMMAGGVYTNALTYALVLQNVLIGAQGTLGLPYAYAALGTNPVCTYPTSTSRWTYCPSGNGGGTCSTSLCSPITENQHYSMGHWVEDEPGYGDGAFSSPGAAGFYPWIDAGKRYYGILARNASGTDAIHNGFASEQCMRLARRAFMTGIVQTGTTPTP